MSEIDVVSGLQEQLKIELKSARDMNRLAISRAYSCRVELFRLKSERKRIKSILEGILNNLENEALIREALLSVSDRETLN